MEQVVLSYAQIWKVLPLAVLGIQIPILTAPELFAVATPTSLKEPTGRLPTHPGICVVPVPTPARKPTEEFGLAPETDKVFNPPATPGFIGPRTTCCCEGVEEEPW